MQSHEFIFIFLNFRIFINMMPDSKKELKKHLKKWQFRIPFFSFSELKTKLNAQQMLNVSKHVGAHCHYKK